MIGFKPSETMIGEHDVLCDYEELEKIHRYTKDIFVFCRVVEKYAQSLTRPKGFWDVEMASVSRLFSSLVVPLEKFTFTLKNAAGDIAVDRSKDPRNERGMEGKRQVHEYTSP
jgi:hypothetical protein